MNKKQRNARRPRPNKASTEVFVSVTGQVDNLGDTALRRIFVRAHRSENAVLNVLVRDMDLSYIQALELPSDARIYKSGRAWRKKLLIEAIRGRAFYGFFAGETQSGRSRRRQWFIDGLTARIVSLRGIAVFNGIGLRDPEAAEARLISWALAPCARVGWRDPASAQHSRVGETVPDWAFGIEPRVSDHNGRMRMAISLRSDRPLPEDSWFEEIKQLGREMNLVPTMVSQVRRDTSLAVDTAKRFGFDVLAFDENTSMLDQENKVRDLYGETDVVISDRLHSIILGLVEGASAVSIESDRQRKITRTLSGAGINVPTVANSDRTRLRESISNALNTTSRQSLSADMIRARGLVETNSALITTLIQGATR